MDNQVTTSNNNEITEEGAMPSSSTTSDSNINYEGTTNNNNDIKEGMNSISNNNGISEDHVPVFVAHNGKWEYDGKEWFFKNFKFSMIVVPKHITLSEITDILHKQFEVDKEFYRLKLEVHYRTGSSWFPVVEIQNNQDLSVFISETSKTKLPLCVTQLDDEFADIVHERRKDHVRVFVAYDGKWEWNGKEWFFKDSLGSIMVVSKYVTLSQIINTLCTKFGVDQDSHGLKLEVHFRVGSPWFPIIEIECDEDLSLFISESSETKLPLCVTRLNTVLKDKIHSDIEEESPHGRKRDRVEKRLIKAIEEGDWLKARGIVDTSEVTWTSKLNDVGDTPLHFAVGRYKNNEIVRDILRRAHNELLETTRTIDGLIPVHTAAHFGNTKALKIMLDLNPKCLFIPDGNGFFAIHFALMIPAIKTFLYLFERMKKTEDAFHQFLRDDYGGIKLLGQVLDTGLIDVAYELINHCLSLATTMYRDKTALEYIIRKPKLFYSGTHYNLWQKFVYHFVPIKNNNFGSTDTADVENQETPKKDNLVTNYTRSFLHRSMLLPRVKQLMDDKVKHNTTIKLLSRICEEIVRTHALKTTPLAPFFLAIENNTTEAIDVLTKYFPRLYDSGQDGQSIYQATVLNRSEKVYSYILHHGPYTKSGFSTSRDGDDNNILHLVGRLAPVNKLNASSGAALQMQRELQWFEELKRVVGITHTRELNKNKETPMMVFRREHEKLRKDGEEWMKKTADSYTITTALIITIVFAAAITVPGGNDDKTGKPIYETKPSFIIFAIADAISLFTATTSLLWFLSILTARYADEDFLYKLPKRLIIGLVMLFVSVTSMLIAFSAALYIMFGQGKAWIVIPIAALACLPIASFVTLQFPLLVELISSTYGHGIFGKEKEYRQSSSNANKKKRA